MRRRISIPALAAVLCLGGCSAQLKHEITVSPRLRELPVHQVCILDPGFPEKFKRRFPDQFPEMAPERRAESAGAVLNACIAGLSASLTVDSTCSSSAEAKAWAAAITTDLNRGRVPLKVTPVALPVESVLLVGVQCYGTANQQTRLSFLWFKPWRIGKPTYDHRCLIQALLVKPQTGEVLFDALLESCEIAPEPAAQLLEQATMQTGKQLLEAFFPKP